MKAPRTNTEGALVQAELEAVAAWKMVEIGNTGVYRDPEDGSLYRFNRATLLLEEVDDGILWSCSDSACRWQQYATPDNGKCPSCGALMIQQVSE